MLVVDGDLSEASARSNISNLLALFEGLSSYQERVIFSDSLAYEIKKKKTGHRFILNFVLDEPSLLIEFNRLALLNKYILRSLVINESKDRGFRALNNPKKIRDYEIRQEKYQAWLEKGKNKDMTNQ
ncbi:30S ribosomal protein S6 [Candidatus Mycoplasma haematobovis]|uniref:Small ribosomal subunit protein bS6 n=2 Tax=Candidatus Mycoplasma haematobovis TaxID=432608 RepID=A0A1A9QF05_9MOLU|nr:30S ribosomal protein S6 [Candidatus Mycoplasma haematobovis]